MNRWISLTTSRAVWVLAAGVILAVVAGSWGLGVFKHLSNGGFEDSQSSSAKATAIITRQFPSQHTDLIALFTSPSNAVSDTGPAAQIQADLATISATPGVGRVTSMFSAPSPNFISKNTHQTFALIALDGSPSAQDETYNLLATRVPGTDALKVQYGGQVAISHQINHQTTADLAKAEILSFPILGILLLIIFRSVVAALVPLTLGGLSILVAFLIVRTITLFTDVSIYAINIITLLGLGLSIDYSLFTVSRFREELAGGKDVEAALETTLKTAGRTVLFSGITVILGMLSLLVFRQNFLRSMGLGGAAAVAATVVLSLTILPAALSLLGRKINALAIPGTGSRLNDQTTSGVWYHYSHFVMRYPLLMLSSGLLALLVIGSPFLHARFSTPDATTVPSNLSGRQVNDALIQNFSDASPSPISVVAKTPTPASGLSVQKQLATYMHNLSIIEGVSKVAVQSLFGNYIQISVQQRYSPQSDAAKTVVGKVRAAQPPAGWKTESGGQTAELVDLTTSLGARIPWAALLIVISTSTLLFLMLGSVVIPVKAIVLNVLSLSAAFGLLVWIFQYGHWAKTFGLTSGGSLDATQPILIFAIAFGLAMDYELFLLSRIKEVYDVTGDTTQAVAIGIQRTAGIITSAALMLVVVIGLFATGKISIIQQVGVGLGAAVAIDATIVRMVLVPSAMRLMGKYNWWAPKQLTWLATKLGLSES